MSLDATTKVDASKTTTSVRSNGCIDCGSVSTSECETFECDHCHAPVCKNCLKNATRDAGYESVPLIFCDECAVFSHFGPDGCKEGGCTDCWPGDGDSGCEDCGGCSNCPGMFVW